MKLTRGALGGVAALAMFVAADGLPWQEAASNRPASEELAYVVIVGAQPAVESALATAHGEVEFALGESLFAARVPASALGTLGQQPGVTRVIRDELIQYTDDDDDAPSLPKTQVWQQATRAPEVWKRSGIDGSGVTIAVLDSGVEAEEGSAWGGGLIKAPNGDKDYVGHGTHVAGIAGGKYGDSSGFRGIAPDAKILTVKVGTGTGTPRVSHLIQAIDWTVANRQRHNIRVLNISATASTPDSYLTGILNAAVERAWFSGIVVVVSAGNLGPNSVSVAPANDPFVITVGAFDDKGTASFSDDALTAWSSNGSTLDGVSKPDVVAPGRNIYSYAAKGSSAFEQLYPDRALGDMYFRLSGTSMSAPMVSGVAALILEKNPSLSPDEVKARIIAAADQVAGSSAGRVDAYDAVFGPSAGRANQKQPINLLLANAMGKFSGDVPKPNSIAWASITWDSLRTQNIAWDSITWDSITWDSITWDSITWDAATADGVTWNVVWD